MEEYRIPTVESIAEFTEKRSRFIGRVWHVSSEEEARSKIEETRKRHHDARHNCWCYRLRSGGERYADDGEPQGTAGQPMLAVFQRESIEDVCCVVTRYFGGTLLGAGGLTRAYARAAKDALDAAGISVVRRLVEISFSIPYRLFERAKLEVEKADGAVAEVIYGADIQIKALLPEANAGRLAEVVREMTAGQSVPSVTGEASRAVPILKEQTER